MTLRLRLLIATAVSMLCGLVVLDVVTYTMVTRAQLQQVDATLQRAHLPIEELATSGRPVDLGAIPAIAPGLFVAVVNADGSVEFTSAASEPGGEQDTVDPVSIDLGRRTQTVDATDGDEMRLRVDQLPDGARLVIGESLHEANETRSRLAAVLLGGSALAIAIASALAWWLLRAGLSPLRRVESSAAAITDSALADQRVPGADDRTEVGRLAATLNEMLDRLQDASDEREDTLQSLRESETRMRRFVADASHELRTPVAATAAYAELFEHGARDRPADLDRAMTGIRRETARMGELVDDLLLLARLDEHRPLAAEDVDLTELVLTSIDAARALDPDRSWCPHINDVVTVVGDPLRLRQVVDNLLANVRAHTPATASCDITLSEFDDRITLTIADDGDGVPDDRVGHLFDRFFRIDDARSRTSGGSGLGLSIVDAIVRAHGGSITADHNDPHGLVLEVRLPRSPRFVSAQASDLDEEQPVLQADVAT
jgi:two-component system OmpR family sensor kinase